MSAAPSPTPWERGGVRAGRRDRVPTDSEVGGTILDGSRFT